MYDVKAVGEDLAPRASRPYTMSLLFLPHNIERSNLPLVDSAHSDPMNM